MYDLPGTYSLTAYSIDEVVTRDFIINEKPDVVVDVLDSGNLERNLYLCMQFQELNVPIVCALNLSDEAEARGVVIDEVKLSKILRIQMVKTVGVKSEGLENLLERIIDTVENSNTQFCPSYGGELETDISEITKALNSDADFVSKYPACWFAIKLLEKDKRAIELIENHAQKEIVKFKTSEKIKRIEKHFGRDSEIVISEQRYGYIRGATAEAITRKPVLEIDMTEKIDAVVLNKVLSLPIFIFIIWAIFQLTFAIGEYPMGWLETIFGWTSELAGSLMADGLLKSLVVDGIIAGVGGVFSFVPLIVLLFLFISILEDTGYMSRIAFIMDKVLHLFGLHGQSFLPMILGFGCSVPAVMASRALKSAKDRIITVLITPFMSCGAKLPVHILLAGAFFAHNAGNIVISIYIIGIMLALISSLIFRKTILKGDSTPFVMELPPYRMPTLRGIFFHVWEKTFQYIKKAGTIILAASVLIWAVTTFPKLNTDTISYDNLKEEFKKRVDINSIKSEMEALKSGKTVISNIEEPEEKKSLSELKEQLIKGEKTIESAVNEKIEELTEARIETLKQEAALEYSIAGRIGKIIEPLVRPIGFDWKIGVSAVTGFAAKEVVVSTLGILYKVGIDETEESEGLRESLRKDEAFNPLVAYVLMLFTLIIAPCFATLAVIKAEIGWKWLGFSILYSTLGAWAVCFVVYQIGSLFV
ncbi:MAG TPA: ferrous iron transport protein B [bacterium]|nr:ferrous iron transport protein B [bacterium]